MEYNQIGTPFCQVSLRAVLGPLLFSLYIHDITTDIDSEIRLFVDDCVCYREIKITEDIVKLQADIDLKWNTHVGNIYTKANRTLGFLRCNLSACPEDVKELAYKGLVRLLLEYGSSDWDPLRYTSSRGT